MFLKCPAKKKLLEFIYFKLAFLAKREGGAYISRL